MGYYANDWPSLLYLTNIPLKPKAWLYVFLTKEYAVLWLMMNRSPCDAESLKDSQVLLLWQPLVKRLIVTQVINLKIDIK